MRNFYGYLQERSVADQQRRIAVMMAERGVDPYLYIENYLDEQLLSEGWLGSFFQRIGNAWNGFWRDPNPKDSPMTRLESAKKALGELQSMIQQNSGANPGTLNVVLRGLEQSLSIITTIEPTLQKFDDGIMNYQKTGAPHSDENDGLPPDLHQRYVQIMQERNQIMGMPDNDQKKDQLIKNDDGLLAFFRQLEDQYQKMSVSDETQAANKEKIKNFLQRIDTDATFREIQNLLDFARRRSSSGMSVARPENYTQVYMAMRAIVGKTNDKGQQKQMLLQWYQALPPNNSVKVFIHQEMQENPEMGSEQEVFLKYAYEWLTKNQHHLANMG